MLHGISSGSYFHRACSLELARPGIKTIGVKPFSVVTDALVTAHKVARTRINANPWQKHRIMTAVLDVVSKFLFAFEPLSARDRFLARFLLSECFRDSDICRGVVNMSDGASVSLRALSEALHDERLAFNQFTIYSIINPSDSS